MFLVPIMALYYLLCVYIRLNILTHVHTFKRIHYFLCVQTSLLTLIFYMCVNWLNISESLEVLFKHFSPGKPPYLLQLNLLFAQPQYFTQPASGEH